MSSTAPVLSGIPQGTVLGPVLFVIYINDLLDNITSEGLMFADDTKVFRLISSREDALELQSDLHKLEQWSEVWNLGFNAGKCHVLTLGKFENTRYTHRYTVCNNKLEHVAEEKDLGVTTQLHLFGLRNIQTDICSFCSSTPGILPSRLVAAPVEKRRQTG